MIPNKVQHSSFNTRTAVADRQFSAPEFTLLACTGLLKLAQPMREASIPVTFNVAELPLAAMVSTVPM